MRPCEVTLETQGYLNEEKNDSYRVLNKHLLQSTYQKTGLEPLAKCPNSTSEQASGGLRLKPLRFG